MSRQYVYVELGEGQKAIATGEDGLPMFEEEAGKDEAGNPTYVQKTADVFHLLDKVPALSKDLDAYKTKLKTVKQTFSPLIEKGIVKEEDIFSGNKEPFSKWFEDATLSIEKAKNFDSIKTKDIDEIKKQLDKATKEKIESIQTEAKNIEEKYKKDLFDADDQIRKLMISDKFASSEFIRKNCSNVPVDIVTSSFANRFKVEKDENGNRVTVGYLPDGKPIYSAVKLGEIADFNEAIGIMIKEDKNSGFYLDGVAGVGTGGGSGRSSQNNIAEQIKKLRADGKYAEASALMRQQKQEMK